MNSYVNNATGLVAAFKVEVAPSPTMSYKISGLIPKTINIEIVKDDQLNTPILNPTPIFIIGNNKLHTILRFNTSGLPKTECDPTPTNRSFSEKKKLFSSLNRILIEYSEIVSKRSFDDLQNGDQLSVIVRIRNGFLAEYINLALGYLHFAAAKSQTFIAHLPPTDVNIPRPPVPNCLVDVHV